MVGVRFQPGSTPQDAPGTPLIYNIHTGKWTDTFIRGTHFDPNAPTAPNPEPPSKDGKGGESEGGGTKSSGAAIGGGVVAILVIIALITFFVIRRRRKQGDQLIHNKDFNSVLNNDHALPSMETSRDSNPSSSAFHDVYSQARPKERESVSYPLPPQQLMAMQEFKTEFNNRAPAGPPLVGFFPPSAPPLPFPPLSPQDHIQQLQHQIADRQDQLTYKSSNPQYNPYGSEIYGGDCFRVPPGPQGVGELVLTSKGGGGNAELQQQINSLQAELNRLQAKLNS